MKNILQHTILAGLFVLLTSGFTPIVIAQEEGVPPPSDSVPVPQEPVIDELEETDTTPADIAPEEITDEPVEETPAFEGNEAFPTEDVTESSTTTTAPLAAQNPEKPTATTDPTPIPAVADPQAIPAKVVVVDHAAKTMTIEVNGKLQLVKINPQVRIMKKGKLVPMNEITAGQSVVLLARPLQNGTFEVVSVAIGPVKDQAEAAGPGGNGRGRALGVGFGQRVKDNPPFFNFPNPANQLGPVVSANN